MIWIIHETSHMIRICHIIEFVTCRHTVLPEGVTSHLYSTNSMSHLHLTNAMSRHTGSHHTTSVPTLESAVPRLPEWVMSHILMARTRWIIFMLQPQSVMRPVVTRPLVDPLCNTLQHTATHCNTLQHTATHCNTPQHTATHITRPLVDPLWNRVCCTSESWTIL